MLAEAEEKLIFYCYIIGHTSWCVLGLFEPIYLLRGGTL